MPSGLRENRSLVPEPSTAPGRCLEPPAPSAPARRTRGPGFSCRLASWVFGILLALPLTGLAQEKRTPPPITRVSELVALNQARIPEPVPLELRATCLFADRAWGSIWISDETGAHWVEATHSPPRLRAGDQLELRGRTLPGQANIDWAATRSVVLATNQFPEPRRLSENDLNLPAGGDIWTELAGIVRRVSRFQGHFVVEFILGSRVCEATLPTHEPREDLVEECEIRCRGVLVPADHHAPAGVHLKLFVPESRFLTVTHPNLLRHFQLPLLARDPPSPTHPGTRVHLRGLLTRQEPGLLWLKDTALGECLIQSAMIGTVPIGAELDAVGVLVRTNGTAHLENALYRLSSPTLHAPSKPPLPHNASPTAISGTRPLRSLAETRVLSQAEALKGWPVSVDATILADLTPLGWDVLFLHDTTSGCYVRSDSRVWNFTVGDRVHLDGRTDGNAFGTHVKDPQIRFLGPGNPPAPRHVSLGNLQLASEDSTWVEIEGWVRHATIRDRVLSLELCDGSGRLPVYVGSTDPPLGIRDALVRLRGAVAARFDSGGQMIGATVYCPSNEHLQIEVPAPDEPFGFPTTPLDELRVQSAHRIGLRRIKIEGTVTAASGNTSLFVQDRDHAVAVRLWEPAEIPTGTRIEAVGIPFWRASLLELRDARVRSLSTAPLPAPRQITDPYAYGPGHSSLRCVMEVNLASVSRIKDTLILDLAGPAPLDARCPDNPANQRLLDLPPGSRLRVTGAVECQGDTRDGAHEHRMYLASANDVEVLALGPWWNRRHTYALAAAVGTVIASGLVWLISLRRLVRVRTAELTQELQERRQAEEALRGSLREKDALLREIHHRVKNNLQIVSSLLSLQSLRVDHPETREALADTQGRVRSMALLHEALYRSGSLAMLDVPSYVENLVAHLRRSMPETAQRVSFTLDIAPVHLDLDRAVPCGVIINELVTNSLKHAFPHERTGSILVRLRPTDGERLALTVNDDGIGLPHDHNPRSLSDNGSLGLLLVSDLIRQLGGASRVGPPPGTSFLITFPQSASSRTDSPSSARSAPPATPRKPA